MVGVVTLPTYMRGERRRCSEGSSHGSLAKFWYQLGPSVVPTNDSQLITGQLEDAAVKRFVWPTIQAVSTPPPLQPYTNRLRGSMYPRPITVSTPAIRSSKSLSG